MKFFKKSAGPWPAPEQECAAIGSKRMLGENDEGRLQEDRNACWAVAGCLWDSNDLRCRSDSCFLPGNIGKACDDGDHKTVNDVCVAGSRLVNAGSRLSPTCAGLVQTRCDPLCETGNGPYPDSPVNKFQF